MKNAMTIAYRVHDGLYLNLTNRCPCACTFCIRQSADSVGKADGEQASLWLDHEPCFDEVRSALQKEDLASYSEVVFCGFGEPTEALPVLLQTARFLREQARLPIRVNTNGLGNLIHGRDITKDLAGLVDTFSISLNSSDPAQYQAVVRPRFKEQAFPAMQEFARLAVSRGIRVVLTTVEGTITKDDEEKCRELCARLDAEYRIRKFIA